MENTTRTNGAYGVKYQATPEQTDQTSQVEVEVEDLGPGDQEMATTRSSSRDREEFEERLIEALQRPKERTPMEKASVWVPTILTMLVLAVALVRFDTTRENTSVSDLRDLHVSVNLLTEKVNSLQNGRDQDRAVMMSLNGEVEALLAVLSSGNAKPAKKGK